jgi:stearoyl-CoA desaturase (delta-9 desaturase)
MIYDSSVSVFPQKTAFRLPAVEIDPLARLDLAACFPLLSVHAGCLLVFVTGWSPVALLTCWLAYLVRAFGISVGYHRYLSHRAFGTSRVFQFALCFVGCAAAQLGPLWWAAHHADHHRFSDTEGDPHSRRVHGFFWAHMGWLLRRKYSEPPLANVPELLRYPELRLLDRLHLLAPLSLVALLFGLGSWFARHTPEFGTDGFQLVVWGFFVSTTLLYHVTFAVNSVAHGMGSRRFEIPDDSRNNAVVALLTVGEGWQNNHHAFPGSARAGLGGWEFDPTWRLIQLLEALGLVWDVRLPPEPLP